MIRMVIRMKQNEFDNEIRYKLFRNVRELLHPAISKKNISDYKIVIDEDILPVRVFYPKKVTHLTKAIIYIHGDGKVTNCEGNYSQICKSLSIHTNSILIAIEYVEKNYQELYEEVWNTIQYLYKELDRNELPESNITIVGDSTGCNIITGINELNKNDISISKEILFYPTLSLEYFGESQYESIKKNDSFNENVLNQLKNYFSKIATPEDLMNQKMNPLKRKQNIVPNTLILVGNVDVLKDEAKAYSEQAENIQYKELAFCSHGFLKKMDNEVEEEVWKEVNDFLE